MCFAPGLNSPVSNSHIHEQIYKIQNKLILYEPLLKHLPHSYFKYSLSLSSKLLYPEGLCLQSLQSLDSSRSRAHPGPSDFAQAVPGPSILFLLLFEYLNSSSCVTLGLHVTLRVSISRKTLQEPGQDMMELKPMSVLLRGSTLSRLLKHFECPN